MQFAILPIAEIYGFPFLYLKSIGFMDLTFGVTGIYKTGALPIELCRRKGRLVSKKFVEKDRGGGGDVERIDRRSPGNGNKFIASLAHQAPHAFAFAA